MSKFQKIGKAAIGLVIVFCYCWFAYHSLLPSKIQWAQKSTIPITHDFVGCVSDAIRKLPDFSIGPSFPPMLIDIHWNSPSLADKYGIEVRSASDGRSAIIEFTGKTMSESKQDRDVVTPALSKISEGVHEACSDNRTGLDKDEVSAEK